MSGAMDESTAPPGSPGYRRHQRKAKEQAFIKSYREKEASANAKLEEERARRAYTRRLRQQLAERERKKQKAEARAALLREKNLRRRESQKIESEEEYQRRIKREVQLKKKKQGRRQQFEQQQQIEGTSTAAEPEGKEGGAGASTALTVAAASRSSAPAGFRAKSPRLASPATSPLRRRLRRKSKSASPRNAKKQTDANKKWMENYRRRQRELEEKKLEAARRREQNVTHKEKMRALRKQEALRKAHERSQAIVDDKQVREMLADPLFEERYGLGSLHDAGANTAWDHWESDVAVLGSASPSSSAKYGTGLRGSYGYGVGFSAIHTGDQGSDVHENSGQSIWDILAS